MDHKNGSNQNAEMAGASPGKSMYKKSLVASRPKGFPSVYGHIVSQGNGIGGGMFGHAATFLLKVATLEVVRRFSKAKFPLAWRGLQALQLLCYPPLKWLQRWAPFSGLVKNMEKLSKPLLVLSIATTFSEELSSGSDNSDSTGGSQAHSDVSLDPDPVQSAPNTSICNEAPRIECDNWVFSLRKELENQGISIPDRINDDELCRFYAATNGDFSSCLSSVKKTIRWRDTYRILTEEELRKWSEILFWHGFDVKHRPCLIVRLGLACLSLPSCERPRFAQAVISQVEHGVLHLVNAENTQITVLVDCEGLPPYRIPMHMMRTCFSLLQDHYPSRLGCLFVIRLPHVVRVISQTLIQVLGPKTREKLRIEGDMYQKVLSECFQMLPLYLGGKCSCEKCRNFGGYDSEWSRSNHIHGSDTRSGSTEREGTGEEPASMHLSFLSGMARDDSFNQVVRTSIIAILMLWLFIALIAGLWEPESRPFVSS